MLTALRELFALRNLVGTILIPLTAFILIGLFQRHVYDWTHLNNRGYERAMEVGGYLAALIILYLLRSPIGWLHPRLKVKLYKEGSVQARPQTSEVLDLSKRERVFDLTIEIEFSHTFWTRRLLQRMKPEELGIAFPWKPSNLLSCASRYKGQPQFSRVQDNCIELLPFERLDTHSGNTISYSFRIALGTTEVVQQTRLKPRHLNLKSRLVFGLDCSNEFVIEIRDSSQNEEAIGLSVADLPADSSG